MHFTEPVYRNPYWPTWPLLQVTQGCSHNCCKFCTMYKGIEFAPQPMELIEEDLREIAATTPDARTIQLLSGNPLALPYRMTKEILELIRKYLPKMEIAYNTGRVTDLRNKTVEQLRELRDLGMREVSLGVESGDDGTLARVNKGYTSQDILEQCHKLEEAGIDYWVTFLNGVAGRSHSREHAVNSAKIFNQCKPMLVGTGGLALFPGTPLLEETKRGEFDPLDERELMQELYWFMEELNVDCRFTTHHTSSLYLSGPFLKNKERNLALLRDEMENGDLERLEMRRAMKATL